MISALDLKAVEHNKKIISLFLVISLRNYYGQAGHSAAVGRVDARGPAGNGRNRKDDRYTI
jgi:hypothetical protein